MQVLCVSAGATVRWVGEPGAGPADRRRDSWAPAGHADRVDAARGVDNVSVFCFSVFLSRNLHIRISVAICHCNGYHGHIVCRQVMCDTIVVETMKRHEIDEADRGKFIDRHRHYLPSHRLTSERCGAGSHKTDVCASVRQAAVGHVACRRGRRDGRVAVRRLDARVLPAALQHKSVTVGTTAHLLQPSFHVVRCCNSEFERVHCAHITLS